MITKALSWYFVLSTDPEIQQAVYNFDRPNFKFKVREQKTYHEADPDPEWGNIILELPTRTMPHIEQWMKDNGPRDLNVYCVDADGQLLEQWYLQGAAIINKYVARGRRTVNKVIRLTVKPKWACRKK